MNINNLNLNRAPVLIPTLNRCEHLKKLLDSLSKGSLAEETDVFIAVDFPPSEKYIDGWNDIKSYLGSTKFNFHSINIIERETNYGLSSPGNLGSLLELVLSLGYNNFIITEDDNFFSPNFLEYINKGLEKFKSDKSILALCGYSFFYDYKTYNNNYFMNQQDFNCWGFATWIDRLEEIEKIDYNYFRRKLYNPKALLKILRSGKVMFNALLFHSQKKNFKKGDYCWGLYMILENKYQIMPIKSLVRNIGWDNSGLHCNNFPQELTYKYQNQEIDSEEHFDFKGSGFEYFKQNNRIIRDGDYNKSLLSVPKLIIKYFGILLRLI